MYAFAIWDQRRQGMFLARDPYGIKPLYYADDGRRIVVASQVKALLTAHGVGEQQNPAGKVSFLLWGFVLEPHTLYRDIHSLPAGSTMWVDAHGAGAPIKYWAVANIYREAQGRRSALTPQQLRPEAVAERLRHALAGSIHSHLVADVPVGVFLSGGLDSATLVALAVEEGAQDLRTITMGFNELRGTLADEVSDAEQIATAYHTRHQSHWVGGTEFFEERIALLAAMDQPSVDGANVYFVSKVAAANGLKVALSGLGGDELFGSYPSFQQIPRTVCLVAPFAVVPQFGRNFRRVSAPILRHFTSPKYASIFEYGATTEDAYLLRRGLFLPWELPEILDPDELAVGWRQLGLNAGLRECTHGLTDMRSQVAALESEIYMRNQLLRDSDWAGMAHSLEIRVPFVDAMLLHEIAPFLIGQTPLGKSDMAATLHNPLPTAILNRPKTGFTVPIRDWLVKEELPGKNDVERGLRSWAKFVLGAQLGTA
jgi:asparagine synthase (glutamine-hydrolysing)